MAAAVLIVAAVPVALAVLSALARRPSNLGVHDGRLAPCPASPNCVCSQDGDPGHRVEPLPLKGSPQEALALLVQAVMAQPRARIVTLGGNYLHAEFTSRVFRFVDDVEFLIDPGERVIHCRSASRTGHSDFGVNRQRLETIRTALSGSEVLAPALSDPTPKTEPLTDADRGEIRRVIELQLAAFQCDDAATAYSFASPGVRAWFPAPERFLNMVVEGYPAVYRPKGVTFGELYTEQGQPTQEVHLIGPGDLRQRAEYFMQKQDDGSWKIHGCQMTR